jgi:hypothetical protein
MDEMPEIDPLYRIPSSISSLLRMVPVEGCSAIQEEGCVTGRAREHCPKQWRYCQPFKASFGGGTAERIYRFTDTLGVGATGPARRPRRIFSTLTAIVLGLRTAEQILPKSADVRATALSTGLDASLS